MKICNTPFENAHKDLDIFSNWKFTLSNFQKWAIYGMLNNKHVLITAHTGSGKTLPAEAALLYFTSQGKRVIYTGPIKALINQKFNEFTTKYPDISFGIITGDNTFNPDATVLLMTAEILRNTLFRKKITNAVAADKSLLSFEMDLDSELACVIVDEAHYINDRDRGRVWEETIMMLPKDIQLLLLSATLNKPEQNLVPLIEMRGGPEVFICPTSKREVPLSHYGYLTIPQSVLKTMNSTNRNQYAPMFDKLHLLKGPKTGEKFDEKHYEKIKKTTDFLEKNRIRVNKYFVLNQIVTLLKTQCLLPAIMFVFSRRQVDLLAGKIQLMLHEEGSTMSSTVDRACEKLLREKLSNWQEYTALPEYQIIIGLLRKGIAIHHAGILKEFREMIELLFTSGYVKLLLATETFAVGINMPTKAVIFTSLQKFDGNGFRYLHPSEYTQMAGRAGRRGIDDKGVVIKLNNLFSRNELLSKDYRHMLTGPPKTVESNFTIHPNLVLQLVSTGNTNFADFISGSMISRDIHNSRTEVEKELANLESCISANNKIPFRTPEGDLERLYFLEDKLSFMKKKKRKAMQREYNNSLDSSKFIKIEYKRYCEGLKLIKKRDKLQQEIENIKTWVSRTCDSQVNILKKEGFIDEQLKITVKGSFATYLQELFSLPIAELMTQDWLKPLNTESIVSVLSCFTNLRLADEQSVLSVDAIDAPIDIKKAVKQVIKCYNKYTDILNLLRISNVEQRDMHFNLCELSYKWCICHDEMSCKALLKECKKYDIGLGDFVKAILKINNIGKELENIATIANDLELLGKLKKIPDLTLKFCITNQSLYL
jgi:antiviral helicase SKI2